MNYPFKPKGGRVPEGEKQKLLLVFNFFYLIYNTEEETKIIDQRGEKKILNNIFFQMSQ